MRPIELFFDLVYVLAITQMTHHLLDHLTLRGAVETFVLLLAVWSAWNATTWTMNYLDPDMLPVRLMLLGVMLTSLIVSASIPEAFGKRGPRSRVVATAALAALAPLAAFVSTLTLLVAATVVVVAVASGDRWRYVVPR